MSKTEVVPSIHSRKNLSLDSNNSRVLADQKTTFLIFSHAIVIGIYMTSLTVALKKKNFPQIHSIKYAKLSSWQYNLKKGFAKTSADGIPCKGTY